MFRQLLLGPDAVRMRLRAPPVSEVTNGADGGRMNQVRQPMGKKAFLQAGVSVVTHGCNSLDGAGNLYSLAE